MATMESELQCPACRHLFVNPVILPCCYNSICFRCAIQLQRPAGGTSSSGDGTAVNPTVVDVACSGSSVSGGSRRVGSGAAGSSCSSSSSSSSSSGACGSQLDDDFDQLSLVSETDSGVVCSPSSSSSAGAPPPAASIGAASVGHVANATLAGASTTGNRSSTPLSITCPTCNQSCVFDENGASNLCKNRALANIVDRYSEARKLNIQCQMCDVPANRQRPEPSTLSSASGSGGVESRIAPGAEADVPPPRPVAMDNNGGGADACNVGGVHELGCSAASVTMSAGAGGARASDSGGPDNEPSLDRSEGLPTDELESGLPMPAAAVWFCEQCEVFYCDRCLVALHPARGPLVTHQIVSAIAGRSQQRAKFKILAAREMNCLEHGDNPFSMFCLLCKIPLCVMCLHDGRHATHDVQALGQMCRLQKSQLSQSLQSLSERAKGANQFISTLKGISARINENCADLEQSIRAQCASLVEAVERRRDELISVARFEKENRLTKLREKVAACSRGLQDTTSLLQLCIEALKEPEPTIFLQIGGILIGRVKQCEQEWLKEHSQTVAMSNFDLEIDYRDAFEHIRHLDFTKNKAPGAPIIIADESGALNNSIAISWRAAIDHCHVDAFVLEISDHDDPTAYGEVYCGPDNVCTIDGLHFNTVYNVRVKALNSHGASAYSQPLSLETSSVASFVFDIATAHPDVVVSADRLAVSADSFDQRLVLGNLGFSSGVHYWELTLTRYDGANTVDVVCGVARYHAARDVMLGRDENGYSMYIDRHRSWFLHAGEHHSRTAGGTCEHDVIGVLLDMRRRSLSFYVNGSLQGDRPAFTDLDGVLYPAVSVTKHVEMSLRTGLEPPLLLPCLPRSTVDLVANLESGVGDAR